MIQFSVVQSENFVHFRLLGGIFGSGILSHPIFILFCRLIAVVYPFRKLSAPCTWEKDSIDINVATPASLDADKHGKIFAFKMEMVEHEAFDMKDKSGFAGAPSSASAEFLLAAMRPD